MKSKSAKNISTNNMLNQITINEKINLEKVKFLFSLTEEELTKYFKNSTDKKKYIIETKNILADYVSNGSSTNKKIYTKSPCNRYYSNNSLQRLQNDIRNFIMVDCYDYDLKSGMFSVALYLAKKHNLPHNHIEYFINNKDMLYEKYEVMSINKEYMNSKCNQDNPFQCKIPEIDNIINQFNSNKKTLISHYKSIINVEKLETKDNPISSQYCHIYYYFEAEIIIKTMNKFNSDKVVAFMFDGFNSTEKIKLEDLNNFTSDYGVKWSIKPIETRFELGNIDNKLIEDKLNKYLEDKQKSYMNNLYKNFQLKNCSTSYGVCEVSAPYLSNTIKYCFDKWYVLDEDNLWKEKKEPLPHITKILRRGLLNYKKVLDKQLEECYDDTERRDTITKQIKNNLDNYAVIDKSSYSSQLKKNLTGFIGDDLFKTKLDCNKYKIAYSNGIYDIKTKLFRYGIYPSDYLTKTLDFPYDMNMIKGNHKDWIMEEFKKICNNNKTHLDYLFSILGYALSGDASRYQHFYYCIGQLAGNGKSALFESLAECFGCYVSNVESQLLEENYSKKHKLIPNLRQYRIIFLNEMKKKAKIDAKIVKLIADGSVMNNEVMYGTNEIVNINCKGFLLSNHMPDFDDLDKGVLRRYTHLQFDSKFSEDYTEDIPKQLKFIADPEFKNRLYEVRHTFLSILLDYAKQVVDYGLPKPPKEFSEEKTICMETNNEIPEFIASIIVEKDSKIISKQEIIDTVKQERNITINSKNVIDYMKQLGYGKKYDKGKMKNRIRGVYVGLDIKIPESKNQTELNFTTSEEEHKELIFDSESDSDCENTIRYTEQPSNYTCYDSDSD